jgi:hypothetical protein
MPQLEEAMSEPFQPHTPWELGVKREINSLQDDVRDHGERLDSHNRVMTSLTMRIRALEVGRSGDGEPAYGVTRVDWLAMRQRAEAAEKRVAASDQEADSWRDQYLACHSNFMAQAQELDAARADVERLRPSFVALTAVRDADVLPRGENPLAQQVSDALLTPHGDGCRKRMYDPRSSPCTCGLADALKETTDAQ